MIGTAELSVARPVYWPLGHVETSSGSYTGTVSFGGGKAAAQPYRSSARELRGRAACLVYEGASSFGSHIYDSSSFNNIVGAVLFDTEKFVSKCGVLASRVAGYSVALLSDEDSTVSSPKTDAKLHLYNLKQYEASFSRRRALGYMFDTLEEAFERKEVEMLNCLLYSAADELRDSSLGVSLLRATFRARKELAMWNFYRDVIQKSLHDHPDAKKLLRGLVG